MSTYCPWCDGEIVMDPESGVTWCPECGNPVADYQAIECDCEEEEAWDLVKQLRPVR